MRISLWMLSAVLLATAAAVHAEDAQVSKRVDALTKNVFGDQAKVATPIPGATPPAEVLRASGLAGVAKGVDTAELRVKQTLRADIKTRSAELAQKIKALDAGTAAMPVGGTTDAYPREALCARALELMQGLTTMAVTVKAQAAEYVAALDGIDVGEDGSDRKIRTTATDFANRILGIISAPPDRKFFDDLPRVSGALQQAYGVSRAAAPGLADEARKSAEALRAAAEAMKSAAQEGAELLRLYNAGAPGARSEAATLLPLVETAGSKKRVEHARKALDDTPRQPATYWTVVLAAEANAAYQNAQDALARIDASRGAQQRNAQVCPGQADDLPHRYEGVRVGAAREIEDALLDGLVGTTARRETKVKEYIRKAEKIIQENREIVKDRNAKIELANERLAKIPANETDRREKVMNAKRERQKQSKEATDLILKMELALQNMKPAQAALAEQKPAVQKTVQPAMRMLGIGGN